MASPFDFVPREAFAPPLSKADMEARDQFVDEYMTDFDALQACIRLGMTLTYAETYFKRMMVDPYVLKQIQARMRQTTQSAEKEKESDRALLLNTLRQAMQHGQYATRVSAAARLAEIQGIAKVSDDTGQELVDALREFAAKAPV